LNPWGWIVAWICVQKSEDVTLNRIPWFSSWRKYHVFIIILSDHFLFLHLPHAGDLFSRRSDELSWCLIYVSLFFSFVMVDLIFQNCCLWKCWSMSFYISLPVKICCGWLFSLFFTVSFNNLFGSIITVGVVSILLMICFCISHAGSVSAWRLEIVLVFFLQGHSCITVWLACFPSSLYGCSDSDSDSYSSSD